MKKIYSLILLVLTTLSFGQVVSEDFNNVDSSLLTANGWVANSGAGTNSVDVGVSNGLTYTGYSGTTGFAAAVVGNAARLDNTGEDVNKAFTTPVTTGSLYYSFLVNAATADAGYFTHFGPGGIPTSPFAARVFLKAGSVAGKINFGISNTGTGTYSATPTDFDINTTYLIIVKYDVSTTGAVSLWVKTTGVPATEASAGSPEVSASGSGSASVGGVYLRQYAATQNITVDGIRVYPTWFNTTPCALTFSGETAVCDAVTSAIDTYTATIPFTGGNSGTYTLSASSGTIGGDNPSTTVAGNILITNIQEGVTVTLTVTGSCGFNKIISAPDCKPVNTIPYSESFNYTVGSSLGTSQRWASLNAGDNVLVATGNLNYTGLTSSGNSASFSGAGAEAFTPFTTTTTGTIYTSYLMNVTDLANTTNPNETYFSGITGTVSGDYRARLFIKSLGTQYQLGFDTASATINYDATLRNVGDVVLVVIGYDFGANSLNAWINPTLATFTAATPASFSLTPTTPIANIGGFILRQDGATSTPSITIDELRVGLTTAELLKTASNSISGLSIYPNPIKDGKLFINTTANAERNVTVYDILGKQVVNVTTTSSEVNVSSLNIGVYIVKVTEEGKTATRKLVIQ